MFFRKRPSKPRTAVERIDALVAEHLPDADDATRELVVAIAGLFASVAYADRSYSEAEQAHVRAALATIHGLSAEGAEEIGRVLRDHMVEIASINPQRHTRALREHAEVELRREILAALVDLAAADGELQTSETELLRRTAAAMGLTQADYVAAQAAHRDRLSVLK